MQSKIKNQKSKILHPPSAFTLVELLVVIVILLILIGIGAAVGPGLIDSQRRSTTRTTLTNARGIATEYEVQTQRQGGGQVVNHLADVTSPFDWGDNRAQNTGDNQGDENTELDGDNEQDLKDHSIERFVWATFQNPDIRTIYGNLDENILTDEGPDGGPGNGFLELRDAWGNKLIYVDSVKHDPPDPSDADDFLPEHSVPYFASPGPDGEWGDARELRKRAAGDDHDEYLADAASDNLYSFDQGE